MSLSIRPALRSDAPLIVQLIGALAAYERLSDQARASEDDILRDLFGEHPRVFCDLALWEGAPVGFGLWYYTYSTFQGLHGIWLEDLYVEPEMRGRGVGKALLVHLARRCRAEQLGRLEWAVLDWNKPSIDFYKSQGAVLMTEWERCRIEGEALRRLGSP